MKHNILLRFTLAATLIVTVMLSCKNSPTEKDGHTHDISTDSHSEEDEHHHDFEEEELHLTQDQIQTIGLELGDFSSLKVNDFIKTTGTIGLPPNAYSSVSAKAEGIIEGTKKFVEGNYIKEGEIIAYVANTDFIIKQQEYLEAKASLKLKKYDLERQQSLMNANAGVTKQLQTSQAEVTILEAKTKGLAKQLSYLGISVKRITANTLSDRIAIVAPMSGYISSITMHNGMYAQPSSALMEIISSDHLHLELDVFEKDIAEVKVGQKISYSVPALGNTIYQGEISVIGKEFNLDTKTVRVHGHLEGKKPIFLKDLFINAKIWLTDTISNAVPEDAIISEGGISFIYVAKENKKEAEVEFKQIKVVAGASDKGYRTIKLLDKIPEGMNIVVKGAYYIFAQSKVGELEHEH